ncbi:hypothetical protein ANN_26422 [Periplaneta americana]|uniref:Mos1 transposase HTH domain-containing protein n=1 Tax=Periplaneta americana TaxID=6978 RepID=A0ABQ8RY57_PERAM|nr:hypothetical protein ANN_26422 [Periplaneta americana]
MSSKEQRGSIKFCVKLGETFTETLALMRQAYGEEAKSRTRVYEWHKSFTSGHFSTDGNPRSGRPSSARTEEMIARLHKKSFGESSNLTSSSYWKFLHCKTVTRISVLELMITMKAHNAIRKKVVPQHDDSWNYNSGWFSFHFKFLHQLSFLNTQQHESSFQVRRESGLQATTEEPGSICVI